MSKLYKENGFLSEYGEDTFSQYLDKEINVLLNSAKNENELRLIGSLIYKRVGDILADRIRDKNRIKSKFDAMSNEEFYSYLKNKYGYLKLILKNLLQRLRLRIF